LLTLGQVASAGAGAPAAIQAWMARAWSILKESMLRGMEPPITKLSRRRASSSSLGLMSPPTGSSGNSPAAVVVPEPGAGQRVGAIRIL
jgi:hypothetical protein